MNTSVQRSTKKSAFEVVFGQKPNTFHNAGIRFSGVEVQDLADITEDHHGTSEDEDVPEDVNFNIYINQKNRQESDKDETDGPFELTNPKLENIWDEVAKNLERREELMAKKYQKTRRVKVAIFNVGETMYVLITKNDRHITNLKSVPCIVIDKSGGKQTSYKLLSEFGVVTRRYNAGKLMPFPGTIQTDKVLTKKLALEKWHRNIVARKYFVVVKATVKATCVKAKEKMGCAHRIAIQTMPFVKTKQD